MRTVLALLCIASALGTTALLSACASQPTTPATSPGPGESVVSESPDPTQPPTMAPTPDPSGGSYGTVQDPPQQDPPANGALEPVTAAGITYLLSAAGDTDAVLHPARFWVDDRSCLRVDVDDSDGYFAVLDPSAIVTAADLVDRAGVHHVFGTETAVQSQAIPRGSVPPEFESVCGSVQADRLWGVGL